MKKILFMALLILSSTIIKAQLNFIGEQRADIIKIFKKSHPEAKLTEGESDYGVKYIFFSDISDDYIYGIAYFFNSVGYCNEMSISYLKKFIPNTIKLLNDEHIKVDNFKWVSKDGNTSYTITIKEGSFFWLETKALKNIPN